MACKRSLYCWKNGPCANEETRRRIWEDNIRFRVSQRELNQSDHYWSFQLCEEQCLCFEDMNFDKMPLKKYRSTSLKNLHQIDCTSITHDTTKKLKNCFLHNLSKAKDDDNNNNNDSDTLKTKEKAEESLSESKSVNLQFNCFNQKEQEKLGKFHKYKSLSPPNPRIKLPQCKNNSLHASLENITLKTEETKFEKPLHEGKEIIDDTFSKKQQRLLSNISKCKTMKRNSPKCILTSDKTKGVKRTDEKINISKFKQNSTNCCKCNDKGKLEKSCSNLNPKSESYTKGNCEKEKIKNVKQPQIQSRGNNISKKLSRQQINHSSLWSVDFYKKNQQKKISNVNSGKCVFSPSSKTQKKKYGESSTKKFTATPSNSGEEFSLYHLHKESSPNFRAGQEVLEIGWGDSPEPLNVDEKIDLNKSSIKCKKKLETKESPKSSLSFKKRMLRSKFTVPADSIVDIAKYVAEVQELSKNIMKELSAREIKESKSCEKKILEKDFHIKSIAKSQASPEKTQVSLEDSNNHLKGKDSAFDSILQTFIDEEDDWLSLALMSQDQTKIQNKTNFLKSKSENELSLPEPPNLEKTKSSQLKCSHNNNFKRASSFDSTSSNPLADINVNNSNQTPNCEHSLSQYSLQEIEKKRLEAKYRKERREIERKKLEAIKKLEMKKLRTIKT